MHFRRRKTIARFTYVAFFVGVALVLGLVSSVITWANNEFETITPDHLFTSRHLLSLSNCTPPAVEQFPKDYFTRAQRRAGAVTLHIILAAYMFLGLALACDEYFVPSCERICEVLNLQDDVAGATFMAAGSSAPELATAVIGVFIAKNDIGLSSVVGSAIFNIMFVISLCALFAGTVVHLKWWPLLRDCLFYTLSITALVIAIMDEAIYWYEALVFLVMYMLYILLMFYNRRIEAWIVPRVSNLCRRGRSGEDLKRSKFAAVELLDSMGNNNDIFETEELDNANGDGVMETEFLLAPSVGNGFDNGASNDDGQYAHNGQDALRSTSPDSGDCVVDEIDLDQTNEPVDEPEWVLTFPKPWYKRALWIVSLPLTLVMFTTVPDCRQPRWKKCFILTFIMSIIWIGVYSYFMVWMITIVGHTWNIPDSVMSLTLIAAGSSVPDAIASLIVVREGHGDMAVSNAVGSNVFDILLCLGLPWFIQTIFVNRLEPIQVYSAGLTYSSITLLSTVVLLLVLTHFNRWRLTKLYGVVLMIIYVAFNVLSCLYELNVFAYVHPPECPSSY